MLGFKKTTKLTTVKHLDVSLSKRKDLKKGFQQVVLLPSRRKGINNFEEEGFEEGVQLVVPLLSEGRRHVILSRSEIMAFQQVVLLRDRGEGSTETVLKT